MPNMCMNFEYDMIYDNKFMSRCYIVNKVIWYSFCDKKDPNNLIFIHWNILFMNIICLINSYPIMNAPYHTRTTIFYQS